MSLFEEITYFKIPFCSAKPYNVYEKMWIVLRCGYYFCNEAVDIVNKWHLGFYIIILVGIASQKRFILLVSNVNFDVILQ